MIGSNLYPFSSLSLSVPLSQHCFPVVWLCFVSCHCIRPSRKKNPQEKNEEREREREKRQDKGSMGNGELIGEHFGLIASDPKEKGEENEIELEARTSKQISKASPDVVTE